jgi:hypothetical protein
MDSFARWCAAPALAAVLVAAPAALWHGASFAAGKAAKAAYNGAIAYHRPSASYGYAVDLPSARAAQIEALKQCGNALCEVVMGLRNNCGAVANGPRHFTVAKGATRQEAQTKALRTCGAGCEIAVWACSR